MLDNADLMAIVSSFLSWEDILRNYIFVCKLWLQSYLSCPWGSPAHIELRKNYPINERFIKHIRRFIISGLDSGVWSVLKLTRINELVIDSPCLLNGIEQLRISKLQLSDVWRSNMSPHLQRFLDLNTDLVSLDMNNAHLVNINRLPKLTCLGVNIDQLNRLDMANLPSLSHINISHDGIDHNISSIYTKLLNSSVTSIFIDAQYVSLPLTVPLVSLLLLFDGSHITHVTILAGVMNPSYRILIAGIKILKVKIFGAYEFTSFCKNCTEN